jgi:hypothetical protein
LALKLLIVGSQLFRIWLVRDETPWGVSSRDTQARPVHALKLSRSRSASISSQRLFLLFAEKQFCTGPCSGRRAISGIQEV